MKRIICSLIVFFACIAIPLTAFAAGTSTYYLEELGMSISLPDDYVVFTRDIQSTDPNLGKYGLTKASMDSMMKERCIFLNAWDSSVDYEIIVTMTESSVGDFVSISDTVLSTLATAMSDQYKEIGISYIKSEVYQQQQAKFIKIYTSQPNNGSTAYGLQYYTVNDGKAINITMQSYSGSIDTAKESILKSIVDSAVFDSVPVKNNPQKYSPSFVYTDSATGAKFTVPENWSQAEFLKEKEYLTAKFVCNLEDGLSIMYGGHDAWSDLSAAERAGLTRSDINNSAYSKSDIAEVLGLNESDITTVTYNGVEYFKGIAKSTQTAYGVNLTVYVTYLICFRDGYIYSFQFNATNASPYYKDFESLVSSAEYPVSKSGSSAATSSASQFDEIWTSVFGIIIINLLITIIIHPVPIWIYRYAIRKKPVEPKTAKKIVIIDAIIVAVLMFFITAMNEGGRISLVAVLVWSRICYSSLTKGFVEETITSKAEAHDSAVVTPIPEDIHSSSAVVLPVDYASDQDTETGPPEDTNCVVFCHRCGAKLNTDSQFCHKCGTKIIK